jgi:hypothetical protein
MNNNNNNIKYINVQIIATYLYIVSLCISLLLTYNEKFEIQNKKTIFTNKSSNRLSIFNRILVVGIVLTFLYINYKSFINAKKKKKDLTPFSLQLTASELSTISAVIVLYVVITSGQYSIVSAGENPNL